jgi:lipopolysaccharide export system protein LptA
MNQRINHNPLSRHRILFVAILCLFVVSFLLSAQPRVTPQSPLQPQNNQPRKGKIVVLERADVWEFDQEKKPDAQILRGSIVFRHEGMRMYCDSAHFYDKINSFEAFGKVRMEQGDTLFVNADYLYYDGLLKIAKLRNHVKLVNKEVTLVTDSLDYDRLTNIGFYFNGGVIVDPENELRSWNGKYNTQTKDAAFSDKVVLTNPKFVLSSEYLFYNTASYVAQITSPSTIVADSTTIYTRKGWYNTRSEESELLLRSVIANQSRHLTGDSICYNRKEGIARVFGNMFSIDTIRKVTLLGNVGFHDEKRDSSYATDSALLIDYSQKDTLYLHADTLFSWTDSTVRIAKGYARARFYRSDIQGVCDTFLYHSEDSLLRMSGNPVLWNEQYQIQGDQIIAYLNDSTLDRADILGNAFAMQRLDSLMYNQLSGKEMRAFFLEKELKRLEVAGNAKTIYFPLDNDSTCLGMNFLESSYLKMTLQQQKMDKLIVWPQPKGSMTPLPKLSPTDRYLPLFKDLDYLRPRDKDGVFQTPSSPKSEPPTAPKRITKSNVE